MTQERSHIIDVLAQTLASVVCADFATCMDAANQMEFIGVDSATDKTVVAVVATGPAADMLLQYLDDLIKNGFSRNRQERITDQECGTSRG